VRHTRYQGKSVTIDRGKHVTEDELGNSDAGSC